MRKLLVTALAVAILAAAGQAMGQSGGCVVDPQIFGDAGEGVQDDLGNPLATYDVVDMVYLNAGVTESNIQTLFAEGNVQEILNDITVVAATHIGVGDSIFCGQPENSLPGYVNGVTVSGGTAWGQFIPYATAVTLYGEQLYTLAVNATSLTASAITQMGMWTGKVTDPTQQYAQDYGNQWIMPVPSTYAPPMIIPDPSDLTPNGVGWGSGCTLDTVIGTNPGWQVCGPSWQPVIDTVWPPPGTYTYDDTNAVQLAPIGLPGDANGDGRVDINDLTIVLAHYGQTGAVWSQGEFTGDGTVDINDLTIVLAHYGQSIGSAAGMSAVPEPSCLILLAVGGAGMLACLWPKRR
jgi:hypothetical protein